MALVKKYQYFLENVFQNCVPNIKQYYCVGLLCNTNVQLNAYTFSTF